MDTIKVNSPIDQSFLGEVFKDSLESITNKIIKAKNAQHKWNLLGIKKRSEVMYEYRNLLKKNAEELIDIIHKENGKTTIEALAEVEKAIEITEFACSMPQIMLNKSLEVSKGVFCEMSHQPLGVVASITPFNFPLMIPHWTVPIALMAGNCVLLKPSELTPLSASRMLGLFKNAGLFDDVFAIINGQEMAVRALCEHEDIKAISFVGSTRIAQMVYRLSTSNLKRALCLGSAKNYSIVLPDADKSLCAKSISASAFGMAGQRCMALSVLIAVGPCEHIIDQIKKEAANIILGSIISKVALERILYNIDIALKDGAKIILDGRNIRNNYIGPTILDNIKSHMKVLKEEIFGPVLAIIRTDSIDEGLAIQNNSPYGNGASVFTKNGSMAAYVKERLFAGMIGINIGVPVPREPFSFGGIKDSKFGCGDITGESSISFWSHLIKCTTKWESEDATTWMS